MLHFQPLMLKDYGLVSKFLSYDQEMICDSMPGTVFMWRHYFQTEFCVEGEALFFRITYPDGCVAYSVPSCRSGLATAFQRLRAYVDHRGEVLVFSPVTAGQIDTIKQYFTVTNICSVRDWFDYVYDLSKMQTYSGKKLHGQRNFLNRFHALYPTAQVLPISSENVSLCRDFLIHVYIKEQELSTDAQKELSYVEEVLTHYDTYGLLGTCVLVEERVVAFAVGSKRGNMLYEHIEKASRHYSGAYQKIAAEFAKMYGTEEIVYVNREDDMGNLSLRTSKLAYQPVKLLEKCVVFVE